jgi:hypothetical protein
MTPVGYQTVFTSQPPCNLVATLTELPSSTVSYSHCLTDEERLFGIAEGTEVNEELATSEHYQLWEEFAGVATNLLEKMESFMDDPELLIGDNEAAVQLVPFT